MEFPQPNIVQRFFQKLFGIRFVAWILSFVAAPVDKFIFWITKGNYSFGQVIAGLPVIQLNCTGAKSGKLRKVPVLALPVGEDRDELLLVASNWGKSNNPGWYYNLKAYPEISITYKGQEEEYIASEVEESEEYERYWEIVTNIYAGYENYRKRTSRERIPIFILKPK